MFITKANTKETLGESMYFFLIAKVSARKISTFSELICNHFRAAGIIRRFERGHFEESHLRIACRCEFPHEKSDLGALLQQCSLKVRIRDCMGFEGQGQASAE